MAGVIMVYTAVEKFELAEALAQSLVERRLAACVNVLGPARAYYRWKGKVEETEERVLLIKTVRDNLDRVREAIKAGAGYEMPEMLVVDVADGDEAYLNWLTAQCAPAPQVES
jgi:periplasmic divalent cation tolerance protein